MQSAPQMEAKRLRGVGLQYTLTFIFRPLAMEDCRGVRRGSCTACGCAAYDGGNTRKKCLDCSHPPGRHKNLDSVDASDSGIKGEDKSEQTATPMPLGAISTKEFECGSHISLIAVEEEPLEASFEISDKECQSIMLPESVEKEFHEADFEICVEEAKVSPYKLVCASPTTDGVLARDERCCYPNCSRPRYIGEDRIHPFCGKYHANLYQKESRDLEIATQELCKSPGCPNFRYRDKGGRTFDYCSKYCRDNQPEEGLAVLPLEERGECSLPECKEYRYQDPANGRVHPFCSRSHASEARQIGISIPDSDSKIKLLDLTSGVGQAVATTFKNTWPRQKGSCPPINFIFSVVNTSLRQTWHKYKDTLSVQDVLEYFHGTTLECNITDQQTLCSNTECGVCGIANVGFDRRCIRRNIDFQRFGHGFYVAPNSSKCHDYTRGKHGFRAMILFDVCPGNKYELQTDDETLTQPPSGYDSVHGKAGLRLNYDELVLYNPDGAFPKYIILYQRDGEDRIAQNLKSTNRKAK